MELPVLYRNKNAQNVSRNKDTGYSEPTRHACKAALGNLSFCPSLSLATTPLSFSPNTHTDPPPLYISLSPLPAPSPPTPPPFLTSPLHLQPQEEPGPRMECRLVSLSLTSTLALATNINPPTTQECNNSYSTIHRDLYWGFTHNYVTVHAER